MPQSSQMQRFADDVQAVTPFDPEVHEREVAVRMIGPENETWEMDLDPLFEAANQHDMEPFEGHVSNVAVGMIRFRPRRSTNR